MPDTSITISVFERNLLWEKKKRFNKEQEWEELIVLK